MENKEVQALDSEYLLSLMKQANTDKDAAFGGRKVVHEWHKNSSRYPKSTLLFSTGYRFGAF